MVRDCDARNTDIATTNIMSMPIAQLSTLEAGVFRVANAAPGDVLKMAKNQNYWGSLKTAERTSKMADMIRIYNYTSEICFDEKKIYLIETA